MQLSLPHLLGRCAILLVSFEVIVCPVLLEFVIESFGDADIYSHVIGKGNNRTGKFILIKSKPDGSFDNSRKNFLQMSDIKRETLIQERSDPKLVSFSVNGVFGNYNLKFSSQKQARLFVNGEKLKLTPHLKVRWARIYSYLRPVIIAYDETNTGDMAFKLLDNTEFTDEYARLAELPYLFKRSDLNNEVKTSPPSTLYLRNKTNLVDYKMEFKSEANMNTFLQLLPNAVFDEFKTRAYFYVPRNRENEKSNKQDENASSFQDKSE